MMHRTFPRKECTLTPTRPVGRGQFGTVYLCKQHPSGKRCCLKVVPARDEDVKKRACREIHLLLMSQGHAGIVHMLDHWTDARALYIVMEYASHGSLDKLLRSSYSLTLCQIGHFLCQIADALLFLHSEVRVMHRDLKPANVLVCTHGQLKLADFGLSKVLGSESDACSTLVGSPMYMAPELCAREPYRFPADVWSAGGILYEMIARKKLWEEEAKDGVPKLFLRIRNSRDHVPEKIRHLSIPMEFCRLLQGMLDHDPQARLSCAAVVDAFRCRPVVRSSRPAPILFDKERPVPKHEGNGRQLKHKELIPHPPDTRHLVELATPRHVRVKAHGA